MPDGLYNMKFRLFTVSSGGSNVWNETRETTNRVQVTNGLFSVRLGDVTPIPASLFASGDLYFEIELPTPATATCSTAACGVFTEGPMTPRNQLATSAYSYNSETLDGFDSADFGKLVANNTWTGTNTFTNTVLMPSASFATSLVGIDTTGGSLLIDSGLVDVDADIVSFAGGVGSDFNVTAATVGLSTDFFAIVDTSSSEILFTAGVNGEVKIGGIAADAVGTVLVLDTKNSAGDPSSTSNGAMYYNSSTGKFRCRQGGTWVDCVATSQTAYDRSTGSTTPEIKLDSTRGGFDIQDADTTIGASLFAVRAANAGGLGSALFNVSSTGIVTAQNSADSATAFTISRSGSGGSLFVADTTNSRVQIGDAAADANGVALVLDTKNSAGDPTGVAGAMYYNSNAGKFRCFQVSWRDCVGNLQQGYDLSTGGTTPEVKLDSTRGGLDIQDADSTIGASLLAVRGSNGAGLGSALFNVTSTGVTTFQNSTDSAAAFTISRSGSGGSLLVADTTNSRIQIGTATADATGIVLVLDTKNNAGDPTGVDGAMYYNSSLQAFRCYQGTEWRSCIGGLVGASTGTQTVVNTAVDTLITTKTYTVPANNCVPGRVYRVTARGVYTSANLTTPSLIFTIRLGSTVVAASTTTNSGNGQTNRQWSVNADIICQTAGVSGTVESAGTFDIQTTATAVASAEMANTAPVTVNTTTSQLLQASIKWGTANANNSFTVRQLMIESLGP